MTINNRITSDQLALIQAIMDHDIVTVTTLLNSGVSPDFIDPVTRFSPLGYLVNDQPTTENIDIIKLLIGKGADPNLSGEGRSPPIFYALKDGGESITLALLDAPTIKLDILGGWNKQAPLYYAVYGNQKDVVKKMLEKRVNINIKNKEKQTPLHIAADRDLPEITDLLIKNGADLEAQSTGGMTPLMTAAHSDSLKSAKILVEAGANVKFRNSTGLDALFFACNNHASDEMITFLIKSGASIYEKIIGKPIQGSNIKLYADGKSVLQLAKSHKFGDKVYDRRIRELIMDIDKKIKSRKNVFAAHRVTRKLGLPSNISYVIGSYLGNQTPNIIEQLKKTETVNNKVDNSTRSGKTAENAVEPEFENIIGGSRRRKTRRCKKNRV